MINFEESSTNAGTVILSIVEIASSVESQVAAMGRIGPFKL